MDIVIKKLSIISNIGLIEDVKCIIKNLWLITEYVIILPPTFEEWNKAYNNQNNWTYTYIDKNDISFEKINCTAFYLNHYIGKMFIFYRICNQPLVIRFINNNMKYENIWV